MKRKFLTLIFFLIFFSWPILIFSQRGLEVEYPPIKGFAPRTVETPLPAFVRYIFNFALAIVGIVGFIVLIWAGTQYITSAGNPAQQREAKKWILAALLGIAILLFSYLLLRTIRGEITFEIAELPPEPKEPIPKAPKTESPDPFRRIRELLEVIKKDVSFLPKKANELKSEVEKCQCENMKAGCDCVGLDCQGIRCLGDPCLNRNEIEKKQRKLIEIAETVLARRNKLMAETEELGPELDHLIFLKLLAEGKINVLTTEEFELLAKEEKEKVLNSLKDLADKMREIVKKAQELAPLANKCQGNSCQPQCQGACHDGPGCSPEKCIGEPCPEIKNQMEGKEKEINNLKNEIDDLIAKIIAKIESLKPPQGS